MTKAYPFTIELPKGVKKTKAVVKFLKGLERILNRKGNVKAMEACAFDALVLGRTAYYIDENCNLHHMGVK